MLRAAHNPYLDALENAIFAGLLLSIRVTNPEADRNRRSVPLHAAVAEAIRDGDGDRATHRMSLHLDDAVARLAAAMEARDAVPG